MNDVSDEVRAEMARQKMSVKELAERLQMPRTTLSARLNGRAPFTVDELTVAGRALGVSAAELMGRAEPDQGARS